MRCNTRRLVGFASMLAGTFIASTSSIFIVTLLALHVYRLTGLQTLSALVPATQWAAALPCVLVVGALARRVAPARSMAGMWLLMGATSLFAHAFVAAVWALLALLCLRGGVDFLAKNARAQWVKLAIEGHPNPQRLGSMVATSQYAGTLAGGLVALVVVDSWSLHAVLNFDALLCTIAALLASACAGVEPSTPPDTRRGGITGWAPFFAALRGQRTLGLTFVALIGLAGLFQGYHQAAKVGLSASLPPLAADSVPGALQAIAGLGIILGAVAGGWQLLYGSGWWIAACLAGAGLAMVTSACLAPTVTWAALAMYFLMMLLFEVGFTVASNQLLIALPREHVPAMHSSSYVSSCAAMILTSVASAAAFERLPLAVAAASILLTSGACLALIALTLQKRTHLASPDVC